MPFISRVPISCPEEWLAVGNNPRQYDGHVSLGPGLVAAVQHHMSFSSADPYNMPTLLTAIDIRAGKIVGSRLVTFPLVETGGTELSFCSLGGGAFVLATPGYTFATGVENHWARVCRWLDGKFEIGPVVALPSTVSGGQIFAPYPVADGRGGFYIVGGGSVQTSVQHYSVTGVRATATGGLQSVPLPGGASVKFNSSWARFAFSGGRIWIANVYDEPGSVSSRSGTVIGFLPNSPSNQVRATFTGGEAEDVHMNSMTNSPLWPHQGGVKFCTQWGYNFGAAKWYEGAVSGSGAKSVRQIHSPAPFDAEVGEGFLNIANIEPSYDPGPTGTLAASPSVSLSPPGDYSYAAQFLGRGTAWGPTDPSASGGLGQSPKIGIAQGGAFSFGNVLPDNHISGWIDFYTAPLGQLRPGPQRAQGYFS